jgi:hypothetical protein
MSEAPKDETAKLRVDIWLWLDFCLHDKDFQDALRSYYSQEVIDKEVAGMKHLLEAYGKSGISP